MRILVTGARGQLGSELKRCLDSMAAEVAPLPCAYFDAEVDYPGSAELDVADAGAVAAWFGGHEPYDLVINCASATKVDACETNEDAALRVNATAVRHLAAAAEAQSAKLVHVSTDYVFSGTKAEPYTEQDQTGPLSAYGRTKLAGERNALHYCSRSFVVRTSWLYGSTGGNFVKTMLRLGAEHASVAVVDDQYGSPTNANDLAYEILVLALTQEYGVYHCTGEGVCSWFEFARAIMATARPQCTVLPCSSAAYAQEHPQAAHRPAHSALSNERLKKTVGSKMRPWKEALTAYLAHLPQDND